MMSTSIDGDLLSLVESFSGAGQSGPLSSGLFGMSTPRFGGAGSVIGGATPSLPSVQLGKWKGNFAGLDAMAAMSSFSEFAQDFCTPFTYLESEKVNAETTGPSLSIVASHGACRIDLVEGGDGPHGVQTKTVCVGPSLIQTKSPPIFTSKHKTGACLITPECSSDQVFGNEVEVDILGTPDDTFSFPLADLAERGGFMNVLRKMLEDIVDPTTMGALDGVFDGEGNFKLDLMNVKFQGLFNKLQGWKPAMNMMPGTIMMTGTIM